MCQKYIKLYSGNRESMYDWMKSKSPPTSGVPSPLKEPSGEVDGRSEGKEEEIDIGEEVKETDDMSGETTTEEHRMNSRCV